MTLWPHHTRNFWDMFAVLNGFPGNHHRLGNVKFSPIPGTLNLSSQVFTKGFDEVEVAAFFLLHFVLFKVKSQNSCI